MSRKPYTLRYPKKMPFHTYIPQDNVELIASCYHDKMTFGNVTICMQKSKQMVKVASLNGDTFKDFLSEMYIDKDADYYIAKNPSCNGKRSKATISSIHNIVIDIDCHDKWFTGDACKKVAEFALQNLFSELFYEDIIPEPNFVHFTGRGLQLWWNFESNMATETYIGKYQAIVDSWIALIQETLREAQSFASVDVAASRNIVGLVRLPGTYNTNTETQTYCHIYHSNKHDLHSEYDSIERPKKAKRTFFGKDHFACQGLAEARMNMLYELRELRGAPDGCEQRNNLNLIFYSAAQMAYGEKEAYERLQAFNAGFITPMTDTELENVICSAKKKHYKFKNETMAIFLDITTDEKERLAYFNNVVSHKNKRRSKNAARDERRQKERAKRDRMVMKLHRAGCSMREIARKTGLDRRTVRSIILRGLELEAVRRAENEAKEARKAARQKKAAIRAAIKKKKERAKAMKKSIPVMSVKLSNDKYRHFTIRTHTDRMNALAEREKIFEEQSKKNYGWCKNGST